MLLVVAVNGNSWTYDSRCGMSVSYIAFRTAPPPIGGPSCYNTKYPLIKYYPLRWILHNINFSFFLDFKKGEGSPIPCKGRTGVGDWQLFNPSFFSKPGIWRWRLSPLRRRFFFGDHRLSTSSHMGTSSGLDPHCGDNDWYDSYYG